MPFHLAPRQKGRAGRHQTAVVRRVIWVAVAPNRRDTPVFGAQLRRVGRHSLQRCEARLLVHPSSLTISDFVHVFCCLKCCFSSSTITSLDATYAG